MKRKIKSRRRSTTAKRKTPSPAQLAARKAFAEMARNRAAARKAPRKPAKRKVSRRRTHPTLQTPHSVKAASATARRFVPLTISR